MDSFLTPYGLSNSGQEKLQFTPLWGGPSRAAQTAFVPELSKAITFFILGPILVKLHILTRLIESFPMVHGLWSCIEIEMLIPLGDHA